MARNFIHNSSRKQNKQLLFRLLKCNCEYFNLFACTYLVLSRKKKHIIPETDILIRSHNPTRTDNETEDGKILSALNLHVKTIQRPLKATCKACSRQKIACVFCAGYIAAVLFPTTFLLCLFDYFLGSLSYLISVGNRCVRWFFLFCGFDNKVISITTELRLFGFAI